MAHAITLPNGRRVSLGAYVFAWRRLKEEAPETMFKGFGDFPMEAGAVLSEMRRGLQDRINLRGGAMPREARAHPATFAIMRAPRVMLAPDQFRSLNRSAKKRMAHRARRLDFNAF